MANEEVSQKQREVDGDQQPVQPPTTVGLNPETVRYLAGQRGAEQDWSRPVNWG